MAVYGINYDEAGSKQPLNYKSVDVRYGNGQKKIFDSGNFVKDWYDLIKFIIKELSETEPHFVGSSSVDHFFMDGADELYDEAYLNTDNDEPKLVYGSFDSDAIKFYVPTGTQPTWIELKELCK
jgi:hypothetical protein